MKYNNYSDKKSNLFFFIFISLFFIIISNQSNQCEDKNCQNCSADGKFCFICQKTFILFTHNCYIKTKQIKNCILSNKKENFCVKCDYGCKPNNGICICTLKYILYIVYFLIIVITIGIFLYCLTHNTLAKHFYLNQRIRFRPFNNVIINNNNLDINNSIRIININTDLEIKKNKDELLEDFYKNKIDINDIDIENKKCDCCNNIICNLILDCGCYVCFDCEKKSIKDNYCLNCHKKFQSMKQITCSICFNNKNELGFFNCQCKMIICKDCYIQWRLKNKNCPTCRTIIL